MKAHFLFGLFACSVSLWIGPAAATDTFSFGVVAHPDRTMTEETDLREAISESDADNLAFVVANGIKASEEPCSDELYQRRKALLDSAKNGVIVSLAGSDWTGCRHANGRSAAIGRLNRLRELFFTDEFSLGGSRLPLVRQSATAKFRNYGENARWEVNGILFATVNAPENNNHFLLDAGRNSEFEDRVVANREWLHRVFTYASLRKMDGVVLFSSGNPFAPVNRGPAKHDGFAELRKQILTHSTRFQGKTLLIHGHSGVPKKIKPSIRWRGDLGVLEAGVPWTKVNVDPTEAALFIVSKSTSRMKSAMPAGQ
ncbi:hypothetical protein [Noviherbaspirillum sp.]|mgnify:CR=1 FL=1|uniref:hypothetical protein n=1 Tax=Noviherbaspirillum sp. TaxID=1926288 RepID=UPI002FDF12B8